MTQQQYERISAPFRTPLRRKALIHANRGITAAVYIIYLAACLQLLMQRDARLFGVVLIPAIPFVLLSIWRSHFNAPRPYEVWNILPLIPKDTQGKSFPSRHVFSAFVIAVVLTPVCLPAALTVLGCGLILMPLRVIGGVHFSRDVLAGALTGLLSGGIGVWLWLLTGGIA